MLRKGRLRERLFKGSQTRYVGQSRVIVSGHSLLVADLESGHLILQLGTQSVLDFRALNGRRTVRPSMLRTRDNMT